MPWNPEKYNEFKAIRYQPFFDLMALISDDGLKSGVDIGCGTGEQTGILSERFENAAFLGIDPSAEMLSKSQSFTGPNLRFQQSTIEDFITSNPAVHLDLVFSNAALQWSDDHEALFPKLISLLNDGGQLAIQMPVQKENLLNQLLLTLVKEKPFSDYLDGWTRESPVLSIDEYAQILFENGLGGIQIIQKVYPIVADNVDRLFDFIAGSALIPYLERLSNSEQELLISEFKLRIGNGFRKFPAMYAFKRVLLYGRKKNKS